MTAVQTQPIEKPTAPGTVVMTVDGETLLLVDPTDYEGWWSLTRKLHVSWSSIQALRLVVVHEGYAPPTPEPIHQGARVVDAESRKLVRYGREDAHNPWIDIDGLCRQWSELPQPVTVVSDGADW